ncbi:hypothetical protein U1Q18_025410, partial [Sarracenia purpurea var. burkii]
AVIGVSVYTTATIPWCCDLPTSRLRGWRCSSCCRHDYLCFDTVVGSFKCPSFIRRLNKRL